ncbi:MAG: RecX family transcriptional regulator [Paludibacteraceae bacterium]|nr:RecX family transcriptional regulator [Paludibacteraceae bacterium]
MEKKEWSLDASINKAARYCSQAERAETDVLEKLFQWGIPKEHHESVITYLRNNNFLNDERYCKALVHDKVAYQSWGRVKIRAILQSKHLDTVAIEQALLTIDENLYQRNLSHLKTQRKNDDPDRTTRFLLQRGYTFDEINQQ